MYIKLLVLLLKKECIGHVQKRVGTSLRKLKRENPGLGGKGKGTDGRTIDKLQNYYGIAIRSNMGNWAGMEKAIHASLIHCALSESRPLHDHCPPGSTSWYGAGTSKTKQIKQASINMDLDYPCQLFLS